MLNASLSFPKYYSSLIIDHDVSQWPYFGFDCGNLLYFVPVSVTVSFYYKFCMALKAHATSHLSNFSV